MAARTPFAVFALLAVTLVAPAVSAQPRTRTPAPVRAADRYYQVRPNDTVRRVAGMLQIPFRELAAANNLRPPYALRVGQRLRIPEGVPVEVLRTLPSRSEQQAAAADNTDARPHRSGVVSFLRQRDQGETTINFTANAPNLRTRVEGMLRARNGTTHILHPRLLRQFPLISDRFAGRRIVILSGFRPHSRSLGPLPNRHAQGYAVDLRVEGVATSEVFAFCQTLANVGCGFSRAADFVHVDVRPTSEHWTYRARTGTAGDPNVPPEDDVAIVAADAAPLD